MVYLDIDDRKEAIVELEIPSNLGATSASIGGKMLYIDKERHTTNATHIHFFKCVKSDGADECAALKKELSS